MDLNLTRKTIVALLLLVALNGSVLTTVARSSPMIVTQKGKHPASVAAFYRCPISFLDIRRGGALESSINSQDHEEKENKIQDEDQGGYMDDTNDDVRAAEEKEAEASTIEEEEGDDDEGEPEKDKDDEDTMGQYDEVVEEDDTSQVVNDGPTESSTSGGLDDPSLDEHSSANIDRMDYADAYDEEVEADQGIADVRTEGMESEEKSDVEKESTLTSGEFASALGDEILSTTSSEDAPKIAISNQITPSMRKILIKQLKYRPNEVRVMRPDIASMVVAKALQRPQEGVPPHWLQSTPKPEKSSRKPLLLSALAVAAIAAGGALNSGSNFVWVPTAANKSRPAVLVDIPLEPQDSAPETEPAAESEHEFDDPFFKPTVPIEHEHSLRPGEVPPTEPIDETILDRALTAVEKQLKSIFGR